MARFAGRSGAENEFVGGGRGVRRRVRNGRRRGGRRRVEESGERVRVRRRREVSARRCGVTVRRFDDVVSGNGVRAERRGGRVANAARAVNVTSEFAVVKRFDPRDERLAVFRGIAVFSERINALSPSVGDRRVVQNRAPRRVVKIDKIERFAQVEVKGESSLGADRFRTNAERRVRVRTVVATGGRATLLENRLRAAREPFERGERNLFRPTFDFGDFRRDRGRGSRRRRSGSVGSGVLARGDRSSDRGAPFLYLTQFLQFSVDRATFAVG